MEFQGCLRKESFRDVLRAISRVHRRGRNPLMRDLMDELKASHSTITSQLERLVEEGYVWLEGAKGQTKIVHLTDLGQRAARFCGARILGEIPAGHLRAVPETDGCDMEGAPLFRESWDEMLPCTEQFGTLFVKGDSMIGDGIFDGDEVHLRCGRKIWDLEQGEIAAVCVGDDYEATPKHVFFDDKTQTVTLRASNPLYRDIVVPVSQVKLVGTWRGIVRLNPLELERK